MRLAASKPDCIQQFVKGDNENRFAFSSRLIPGGVCRAQVRTTLRYRIASRLQAGVEVNPCSTEDKANPLVNWLALPEGRNTPTLIVGTSSDRTGTPEGQSSYARFSKNLKRNETPHRALLRASATAPLSQSGPVIKSKRKLR